MECCQLPECPKALHPSQLVGCQVETLEGRKLETGCARELVAMEIKYLQKGESLLCQARHFCDAVD